MVSLLRPGRLVHLDSSLVMGGWFTATDNNDHLSARLLSLHREANMDFQGIDGEDVHAYKLSTKRVPIVANFQSEDSCLLLYCQE